jgi:nitroimidazol reductase NimA-like FMN-containing flavoprotein (pyridoxamine 5'-phosphate oxidase superfamily)
MGKIMSVEIKNILSAVRYATISTVDEQGKAWAAPVWYVFDEKNTLYWWSPITLNTHKILSEVVKFT